MTTDLRYLRSVTFLKDHRCYKKDEIVEFRAGINYLVGDQGSGKSTLLDELRRHVKGTSTTSKELCTRLDRVASKVCVMARDFEKENVRTQAAFDEVRGVDFTFQVAARFLSHGETVRPQVLVLDQIDAATPTLLLLDEPDNALSPRSIWKVRETFAQLAERGVQIIAAIHHPWLIEGVPEVLSLEHKRWMPSDKFLEAMRKPATEK